MKPAAPVTRMGIACQIASAEDLQKRKQMIKGWLQNCHEVFVECHSSRQEILKSTRALRQALKHICKMEFYRHDLSP
jgi:hypothetical protein